VSSPNETLMSRAHNAIDFEDGIKAFFLCDALYKSVRNDVLSDSLDAATEIRTTNAD
jgi:hypothetical protein